ncbi:polysaccharide biosynthesis tyrosine autokinase [Subtercola boreus]|uniref:polysaccharide biosynthesis tyrosine autokinase n=1 Tax=Subtercola boreus TaxID=120213 RepID=UPI001172D5C6|nr:polysaccharide biosynthesis tyrosine autokinase [Subtercola boreus]TQL54748.1 capsular exopolysaccharide synthesis family protein [Subtercola boreus]
MDLSGYLRVLRAHWIAIVVFMLVGGLAGYGWSLIQPRVYTADASGIITTGVSTDLGSALVGDNYAKSRVKSYLNVAKSRSVAAYAVDKLGLQSSPEDLISRVTVSNPIDTAVLAVSAQSSTPEGARDLAETWIAGMVQQVTDLENSGTLDTTTAPAGTASIVKLQTLDSAVLPASPSSPNTRLAIALGFLFGAIGGIGYAFVRNTLDRRIRSVENVEKAFGLAVVGTIPFDRNFTDANRLVDHISSSNYSVRRTDDDAVAEALRELRTNLQFMDVDNPPRIIVVTSSLPGDGKSTITANLATTIAASGQRVVVVDGDLRRPTVAKSFNLLPGVGLTDVLVGRAEIEDVLQPWGDSGRLMVMGAGVVPPNPSELLGSRAMQTLLNHLARDSIVLIDAPPLIPVTDAAILTACTDGALVVASVGKTTTDALGKALNNLERVNGRALGVILNRVPRRGSGSTYYGYQYKGDYNARVEDDVPVSPIEPSVDLRSENAHARRAAPVERVLAPGAGGTPDDTANGADGTSTRATTDRR